MMSIKEIGNSNTKIIILGAETEMKIGTEIYDILPDDTRQNFDIQAIMINVKGEIQETKDCKEIIDYVNAPEPAPATC